jgi:hypothetical protein
MSRMKAHSDRDERGHDARRESNIERSSRRDSRHRHGQSRAIYSNSLEVPALHGPA